VDEATRTSGPEVEGQQDQRSPEEIRADIKQTREELGDTVEELAAKTDVKAKAQEKADEIKQTASDKRVPIIAGVAIVVVAIILIRR
jgi:hypothetical protein